MKTLNLVLALAFVLLSPTLAQGKMSKKKSADGMDAVEMVKQKPMGTPYVYKTVEGRELHLFVINPADWKATDKRPAIVFFHGGGWEIGKGAPTQFNYQGKYLATRGMVSIQVEYRLIANNRKETPLGACQDAKSAMRWVRSHSAELGIDPNRIAAGGGSAGGHLAAFVGMVEGTDDPNDNLKVSCRPNAMVLYNPALLHADKFANSGPNAKKPAVMGDLLEQYKKISPYFSVSHDDPPGIILVGSEDGILPQDALQSFLEKCKAAGVRMESVVYPGEGHSFFGLSRSLDRFFDTTTEMDKFLGSLGWLSGPPTLTKAEVKAFAAEYSNGPTQKKAE